MGFAAVLKDRCRTVRSAGTGRRVYGEVQTEPERGPWIRCRLQDVGGDEAPADDQSVRRYTKRPSVMIKLRDVHGQPIDVRASDVLEVESKDLGDGTWQVLGGPRPIRKKVGIHHYEANLVRVREDDEPEEPGDED